MKQQGKNESSNEENTMILPVHLLRGPLLLSVVIFALIAQLSHETLLSVGLLGMGLTLTCHDLFFLLENKLRELVHRLLNAVVLDDVMKSLFDPTLAATVLGNATMYTLPMSRSQRLRLLQSCLLTSEKDTAEILTAPGGVRQLLPLSMQEWLEPTCEKDSNVNLESMVDEDEESKEESTSHECHDTDMETDSDVDKSEARTSRSIPIAASQSQEQPKPTQSTRLPPSPPQDPLVVMGSIVKELSMEGIHRVVQGVPDSWLRGASVAGILALCLQLRASPRARHIVLGLLEGSTAMGFAGVALGAMSALAAKQNAGRTDPSTRAAPTAAAIPMGLAQTILKRAKELISTTVNSRQLQATIALLVMYYFRRGRRNRAIPSRRL